MSSPQDAQLATPYQARRIWYLTNNGHYGRETLRSYIQRRYQTSEPGQLTRAQASAVIDKLKAGEDIS